MPAVKAISLCLPLRCVHTLYSEHDQRRSSVTVVLVGLIYWLLEASTVYAVKFHMKGLLNDLQPGHCPVLKQNAVGNWMLQKQTEHG